MAQVNPLAAATVADHAPRVSKTTKVWRSAWMLAALVGTLVIVGSLLKTNANQPHAAPSTPMTDPASELARVAGPAQLFVKPDTPLARSLHVVPVEKKSVSYPLLTVTGSVVARVSSGPEPLELRWQFASPEIASAYSDWLKTSVDIEFNQKQLDATIELTKAQVDRLETVVNRLKPLAAAGSVPAKEYTAAEADLVQAKLQGQKQVYEAESALRSSQRQRTSLERQLAQGGIEPVVFKRGHDSMVLVSANVPESSISLVTVGQPCEATFFGFPGKVFTAHVEELGTVLSTERRTLRVLFELSDADNKLKPGMFGEIGLGTDARDVILVPTDAVVHLGRTDYVFRRTKDSAIFDVVAVEVSDSPGEFLEVIKGLKPGDEIVASHAVLLKPLATRSLAP